MKQLSYAMVLILALSSPGMSRQKQLTDAVVDVDFHHQFTPRHVEAPTRVLIDRYHKTIYANPPDETGAEAMLDIMARDKFSVEFADRPYDDHLTTIDLLIIHGLPNDEVRLPSGEILWRSPLSNHDVESIVRWIDGGGALFLTLSHFPNGSGARPLLDAMGVKFADGYIWHPSAPAFDDPDDGRCSHFFGMSPESGEINSAHPALANGLPVRKVDYLCGAAIARSKDDAIVRFPPGSWNHSRGKRVGSDEGFYEVSDNYAGVIGFKYGRGRVVIAADQGMFRNFIFTFDKTQRVYVTISNPQNDNANLFIDLMRWLATRDPDAVPKGKK